MHQSQKDLKSLTVNDLRKLARREGLSGFSRLRKAELVALLEDQLQRSSRPKSAAALQAGAAAKATAEALAEAPSSEVHAAPRVEEKPAEDPGAMRDPSWNPPELPSSYGLDRLTLMVRDPHWLFCYWEVDAGLIQAARAEFSGSSWQVLRVHLVSEIGEVLDGWEHQVPEFSRSWYVNTARPGARFRAELGLTDASGRYRRLVASNTVQAPADSPSGRWDEEWVGISRETWERLERAARPFPGSLGGVDFFKRELSALAAARVGGSELISSPSATKASKS